MTSNSTAIRSAGYTSAGSRMQRQAFTLSNGNAMVITRDPNFSGAPAGYGERNNTEKIYIYESVDRITWTLRGTTTAPNPAGIISAGLYADNSLFIVNAADGQDPSYSKFTYSTYTFAAWASYTVTGNSGKIASGLDVSVSDAGMPVVALLGTDSGNNNSVAYIHAQPTGGGAFALVTSLAGGPRSGGGADENGSASISVTTLNVLGGNRRVVFSFASTQSTATDLGVMLRGVKITESTAALSGVVTNLGSVGIGEGDYAVLKGRKAVLFRTGTDEVTLGVMNIAKNRTLSAYRFTWDGTTQVTTVPYTSLNSTIPAASLGTGTGISYGNDTMNLVYCATNVDGEAKRMLVNYVAKFNRTAGSVAISGNYEWDDYNSAATTFSVSSGGDRNIIATAYHDTLFAEYVNSTYFHRHIYANMKTALLSGLTPANASTTVSSNPPLSAKLSLKLKYGYSRYKIRWQFAKDTIFTTNLIDYYSPDTKLQKVNGTDGVSTVTFTDVLSSLYRPAQGVWYIRAAAVDDFGNQGPWVSYNSLTIAHPPSATNLSPAENVLYSFGSGSRRFTWSFSDPSVSDTQTAFQIIVENATTGASLYNSAKVSSTASSHTATMPAGAKDVPLRWKVRVYDTDDVVGAYSDYAQFNMSDPATVVVNLPTNGSVLTSGVPSVQFTPTVTGGRTIVSYQVFLAQGGLLVWTSGPISTATSPIVSGTTVLVTGDKSYMSNNSSYSVYVVVTDNLGLSAQSASNSVTTLWVPPASPDAPTLDASMYDTEGFGYVSVFWTDTTRDIDFNGWLVQRRDNLINPDTGAVINNGIWTTIYTQYSTMSIYEYKDYLSPSNTQAEYRILQQVNRSGDIVESLPANSSLVIPVSDAYWLVTPVTASSSPSGVRLSIVSDDQYTDEYEEATYNVIGRGRHVDYGERLGKTGSLTAKIRNTAAYTARQKRQQVLAYKEAVSVMYLRDPFGDVSRVAVSNIGVSRIAGVGKSEFVDLTVPYSEVD